MLLLLQLPETLLELGRLNKWVEEDRRGERERDMQREIEIERGSASKQGTLLRTHVASV